MSWGSGGGTGRSGETSTPVAVAGLEHVRAIAAGPSFSLALLEDGKVMSWGHGDSGELGDGGFSNNETPGFVAGIEHAQAISAGGETGTALLEDGTVEAWGSNGDQALGISESVEHLSDVPVQAEGLSSIASIATGEHFTLAIREGGALLAIGENEDRGAGGFPAEASATEVCAAAGTTLIAGGKDAYAVAPTQPLCLAVTKLRAGYGEAGESTQLVGVNFGEVTAVEFGGVTTSFTLEDARHLTAVVPAGEGSQNVTVRSATHASQERSSARFVYVSPPTFGLCRQPSEPARFATDTCTTGSPSGSWEWIPTTSGTFATTGKAPIVLETAAKVKTTCTAETGTGEYTSPKTLANVVLAFSGCERLGAKCASAGQAEGVIHTDPLAGVIGLTKLGAKPVENTPGVELAGAAPSRAFAEFTCGAATLALRGGTVGETKANTFLKTGKSATIKFNGSKGKQKPEAFVGGTPDRLESSLNGGALERIDLKSKLTVPLVEFNTVI